MPGTRRACVERVNVAGHHHPQRSGLTRENMCKRTGTLPRVRPNTKSCGAALKPVLQTLAHSPHRWSGLIPPAIP